MTDIIAKGGSSRSWILSSFLVTYTEFNGKKLINSTKMNHG